MDKQKLYSLILDDNIITTEDAISFVNQKIEFSQDKGKSIDAISNAVNKLNTICLDLKLELRLHSSNPQMKVGKKHFFTTKEAADILEVSQSKIRDLINKGDLKKKVVSKTDWRIPALSLESYKSQLSELMVVNSDSINYDSIRILDAEMQEIEHLISNQGIRKMLAYETRIRRKINNIFTVL